MAWNKDASRENVRRRFRSRKCCFEVWASDARLGMKNGGLYDNGGKTPFSTATVRDVPYGNQYFRVDLGTGERGPAAGSPKAFCPISRLMYRVRTGNDKVAGVWTMY